METPDKRIIELIDHYGFDDFMRAVEEAIPETDEAKLNPEEAEEILAFVAVYNDDTEDGDDETDE